MTKFEYFKNMNEDELAQFLFSVAGKIPCDFCNRMLCPTRIGADECLQEIKSYLKSEFKNESEI